MSVQAQITSLLVNETGYNVDLCRLALERSKNNIDDARALLVRWRAKEINPPAEKTTGITRALFDKDAQIASIAKLTTTSPNLSSEEISKMMNEVLAETIEYGGPYLAENALATLEEMGDIKTSLEYECVRKTNNLCLLTTYNHRDNVSVVVETEAGNELAFENREFRLLSFNLAMHIAAFNPISLTEQDIPNQVKEQIRYETEKELMRVVKPLNLWPQIVQGKISKWADKRTLISQIFIKSDNETVEKVFNRASEALGCSIKINKFIRYEI